MSSPHMHRSSNRGAVIVLVLGVAGMILCAALHVWLGILTTAVTMVVLLVFARLLAGHVSRPAAQTRIRIAIDHGPATHVQNRADRVELANRRLRARLIQTRAELEATREQAAALASRPTELHQHLHLHGDDARQMLETGSGQFWQPDRQAIEERS